ncbi:MAG: phenylacetate--CoA ligase family protein, partial [Proteobacteria bacterium]|nr:phenylacetate--CoA ligase family protein [Pseudomonadota bacterium]
MPEERPYFNMDIEPMLNTAQMKGIQWEKLQTALRFFYDRVPFERRRMDRAGVKPDDIKSFDDFSRSVPIIGQADYREA